MFSVDVEGCTVPGSLVQPVWKDTYGVRFVTDRSCWCWSDPMDLGPISSSTPLAPYMTRGMLQVRLRILSIDGMKLQ